MLCNPGSLCLVTWELWNHFFRGKELERLIHSAVCDRHHLAYQAEAFILASHGDIYPLTGSGVCAWHCRCGFWGWTPSAPSPLLPTCQQAFLRVEFWEMFRCVIFHPLAPYFCMQFRFHEKNMPLLPTRAQWPSLRKEEFPFSSFLTLSLHHFRT